MPRWSVETSGDALGGFLRARTERPWSEVKRWVATGKFSVAAPRAPSDGQRLTPGQSVELRMAAPRRRDAAAEVRLVFEDAHLVVIDKPAGISSVPFEEREQGTAMDLI